MNETVNLDACAEIAQNLETCLDEGQNAAFQIWTLNISRRETKEKLILLSYPDKECLLIRRNNRHLQIHCDRRSIKSGHFKGWCDRDKLGSGLFTIELAAADPLTNLQTRPLFVRETRCFWKLAAIGTFYKVNFLLSKTIVLTSLFWTGGPYIS